MPADRLARSIGYTVLLMLGGCSFAPEYRPPSLPAAPDHYQEAIGSWRETKAVSLSSRDPWWQLFKDPTLDRLEQELDSGNQTLAAALARYDESTGYLTELRGGLFPSAAATASANRNRQSNLRPLRGSNQPNEYSADTVGGAMLYELDLWGRVRNEVSAGQADVQAAADDLAAVRLSLQAQLADDYVSLRGVDAQIKLLQETAEAYSRALTLTQNRYAQAVASGLDVARAQTQLDSVKAEVGEAAGRRATLEHAIAALLGRMPSDFQLEPSPDPMVLPDVPVGVPSDLLLRRPDVAAAERRVAAANALIGVARSAWFPSITLTASGGWQNTGGTNLLFAAPNTFWSIGPTLQTPLFDAGRISGSIARAKAQFDEATANYRNTALGAFREVEDNLGQLVHLQQAAADEDGAAVAAARTLELSNNRYSGGIADYLDVVVAQTTALQVQNAALDLRLRRLLASVGLIRALGGGWDGQDAAVLAASK